MSDTQVQAPGSFCWSEACTSNLEDAKKFYSGLFGWSFTENKHDGGGFYYMGQLDGTDVSGLYELQPEQAQQGVPPHWMAYVLVEDLDASTAKVAELGGTVVMGPFDVMEFGRMTVFQDPTGAVLSMWQPLAKSGGAAKQGVPGSPCWFELISTDRQEATAFYAGLFGWQLETWPGPMDYVLLKNGEASVGGAMQRTPEMGDVPSHWMTYFAVADCDATCARTEELGGKVIVPAQDIPGVGRSAVVSDPSGAMFSVIKLEAPS